MYSRHACSAEVLGNRSSKSCTRLTWANQITDTFNNNNNNNNNNKCKALGFEATDKWYTHMPKPVCEKGDVTVLWNQAVHTDREVTANRPDIIIKNKEEETCTQIDVAIPADRNVVQKGAEKKLKYKSLCIEIQRMWNLKCTIIPVIIGATGIVTRSLRQKFGSCTRKTFAVFTTKDRCTWNITHNTESTAV